MTRAGLEPLAGEIWARAANGCGHRQIRMCLVHGFGRRVSAKTVLRVMRRMGLKCPIRAANPWRRYGSYGGDTGGRVPNPLKRDFGADGPFAKLGADVAEFKVAGSKAYLAPVYDMAGKEIVFCQIFVGRFGVSFSPFERLFLGRFGFGQSCGLSVIA